MMGYIEVFYNPNSLDWGMQIEKALAEIDYTPDVILCYPRKDRQTNFEFRFKPKDKTD